jgi:hypothetical protein
MSACKRWQESLVDHALGEPPSAELQAHFSSCRECSSALESLRNRARQIDDGVCAAVTVEPPPQLEHRILLAASAHRSPALWRWSAAAVVLLAATAAATLVVRHDIGRRQAQERQQLLASAAALSEWRSPTASLLVSPSRLWLGGVPQLGRLFFEMKPLEERSGQEK